LKEKEIEISLDFYIFGVVSLQKVNHFYQKFKVKFQNFKSYKICYQKIERILSGYFLSTSFFNNDPNLAKNKILFLTYTNNYLFLQKLNNHINEVLDKNRYKE
jgi:hypothetical protein